MIIRITALSICCACMLHADAGGKWVESFITGERERFFQQRRAHLNDAGEVWPDAFWSGSRDLKLVHENPFFTLNLINPGADTSSGDFYLHDVLEHFGTGPDGLIEADVEALGSDFHSFMQQRLLHPHIDTGSHRGRQLMDFYQTTRRSFQHEQVNADFPQVIAHYRGLTDYFAYMDVENARRALILFADFNDPMLEWMSYFENLLTRRDFGFTTFNRPPVYSRMRVRRHPFDPIHDEGLGEGYEPLHTRTVESKDAIRRRYLHSVDPSFNYASYPERINILGDSTLHEVLQIGADSILNDERTAHGRSFLHYAAAAHDPGILHTLVTEYLENETEAFALRDNNGETPLLYAARMSSPETVLLALKYSNPHVWDYNSENVLHAALSNQNPNVLIALLETLDQDDLSLLLAHSNARGQTPLLKAMGLTRQQLLQAKDHELERLMTRTRGDKNMGNYWQLSFYAPLLFKMQEMGYHIADHHKLYPYFDSRYLRDFAAGGL